MISVDAGFLIGRVGEFNPLKSAEGIQVSRPVTVRAQLTPAVACTAQNI
jgi:hypothetical protein